MQENPDLARRFAALAALGFERTEEVNVIREVEPTEDAHVRVSHSRRAMGTRVKVTACVRSPGRADEAIGRALEEMDRLVGIFSHHDSNTAATELNDRGRLEAPPPELVEVLASALRYHRLTRGGFDVTVAPIVELFRSCPRGTLPAAVELNAAAELVGAGHLEVTQRNISFARPGMRLTLDGIAKGFIVDAISRQLEHHGIRDYLVEAGGDLRAAGSPGGGRPWRVAIQDPDGRDTYPDFFGMSRGAVATSGGYEEFYDPQGRHHHIVDAGSGVSPCHSKSVTITASNAMGADALATSVFLMQPEDGLDLLSRLRGCEGLIIAHDGTKRTTSGWRGASPS